MTSHTRKSQRKLQRKNTRKTQAGGKRSAWLKKVMKTFKALKAKNPKATLGDAMKAAKQI